LTKTKRYSFI